MKKTILLFIGILTSMILYSQSHFLDGIIVKNNGDTIIGKIKYLNLSQNSQHCIFKSLNSDSIFDYSTEEIKSYKIGNDIFYVRKSFTYKKSNYTQFARYVIDGIVDLFYFNIDGHDYYLLQKDGSDPVVLSNDDKTLKLQKDQDYLFVTRWQKSTGYRMNSEYKQPTFEYLGKLKAVLRDQPQVFDQIDKTLFNSSSIAQTLKLYHTISCSEQECIDYSIGQKHFLFTFAPIVSYRQGKWKMDFASSDFNNQSIYYGIVMDIRNMWFDENFTLQYMILSGKNTVDLKTGESYQKEFIKTTFRGIENNFGIKYLFLNKKLKSYFQSGLKYSFIRKDKIETNLILDDWYLNYLAGVYGGLGIQFNINSTNCIRFAILYNIDISVVDEVTNSITLKSFGLSTEISF